MPDPSALRHGEGCGTMSPHVLRAIGPEPWAVAYPEPCRRPTDGRYGDNPNRAQHYFQYQVLIKPSRMQFKRPIWLRWKPWAFAPRTTTFASSRTTGSPDPRRLGCGLGGLARWHGGDPVHLLPAVRWHRCRPVSIEITYGLERLAMYLQDVESIWDLSWDGNRSYGDIWLPFEKGQCTYNFGPPTGAAQAVVRDL